jgi:hypothetical protein
MTLQREHAHGARRVNANVLVLCVRRQNKRENEAQLYVCFPTYSVEKLACSDDC